MYVWDADGKRYLDFSGSAAVNLIGHGVPEISAAMAEQAGQLEFVHTSQFTTPVAEGYAKELLEFSGGNFRGGAVRRATLQLRQDYRARSKWRRETPP